MSTLTIADRYPLPSLPARPKQKAMLLSADPIARKNMPITTGVMDYFPLAMAEVAKVSKAGNDQHNPGQPLHWDKTKSLDHADCIGRHLIDRGSYDSDGMRHSAKLAWRALANLETELESEAKGGGMKLYISGPMTGIEHHNFPAFNAAADRVRDLGHEAVNPVDINPDVGTPWHMCLRADIKALCDCDGIVLLPGWEKSTGAQLELHIAHRLGLTVQFIETMQ